MLQRLGTKFFTLISFLIPCFSFGQNLSAYTDYKDCFIVYDNEITKQIEYLPVKSFQVGGNCIAYIDNVDAFKVYYAGETIPLLDVPPQFYSATDDLLIYLINGQLFVFDNKTTVPLTYYANAYSVGDSIIAFTDKNFSTLRVYYNGEIKEIENKGTSDPVQSMKTGDNILAYVDYNNYFKIFYHNEVKQKEEFQPVSYQAGNNIVSYIDGNTQLFKVFYSGKDYKIDNLPPQSYQTGDDMVAYVDNDGRFKVFYNGAAVDIAATAPDFYKIEDNILVYGNAYEFKVFYKGTITSLENYIPENYKIDYNTLAYIDRYGILKALSNGKLVQVDREKVADFILSRDVIQYSNSMNRIKFFSNGK